METPVDPLVRSGWELPAGVSESLGCDARGYIKGYLSFVSMVNEVQALRLERLCPPGLLDI